MKGVIATLSPSTLMIPFASAKSFIDTVSYARHLYGYENVRFAHVEGPLVEENRNNIFELSKGADWLLMADSDMVFESWQLPKMIKDMQDKDADLICGVFRAGHSPHDYTIYTNLDTFERLDKEHQGIIPIEGCGTAFILIGKRVLENFTKPFYRIDRDGKRLGQDISFCLRLRDAGYKMYCDTDIKIGHLRLTTI
jgi:GT2 family glycosyltransferase